jgi:hypothetical protein
MIDEPDMRPLKWSAGLLLALWSGDAVARCMGVGEKLGATVDGTLCIITALWPLLAGALLKASALDGATQVHPESIWPVRVGLFGASAFFVALGCRVLGFWGPQSDQFWNRMVGGGCLAAIGLGVFLIGLLGRDFRWEGSDEPAPTGLGMAMFMGIGAMFMGIGLLLIFGS